MEKSKKTKSKPKKTETKEVVIEQKRSRPAKTISRISHVPMQSVKMIKMGPGIIGSSTFATLDFSVNAGNSSLWPRLAQVARTYQYWRAVNWHVKYEPIASMFGANKSGNVTLSLLENWYDAPPDSMTAQTERARRSVTVPAWQSGTLKLDPTRWKYVRDSPGSQGQDMRLDDEVIEVGTEGTDAASAGQVIGYLYLTADIEFRTPYTVSISNAPRTNTVFVLARKADFSFPSSPGGTSTAVDCTPASDGFLSNAFYSGASVSGGVIYLVGGTYNVRVIMNFVCASSPAFGHLSFASTGHKQLIQVESAASSLGANFQLLNGAVQAAVSECVVSVPEGNVASLNPVVLAVQAASTPFGCYGLFVVITPH